MDCRLYHYSTAQTVKGVQNSLFSMKLNHSYFDTTCPVIDDQKSNDSGYHLDCQCCPYLMNIFDFVYAKI